MLLSRFLVSCMLRAKPAELLVLNPARLLLLVLRGREIPALALRAFKCNDVSHACSNLKVSLLFELATGIEPVTSSLPRKCSTN